MTTRLRVSAGLPVQAASVTAAAASVTPVHVRTGRAVSANVVVVRTDSVAGQADAGWRVPVAMTAAGVSGLHSAVCSLWVANAFAWQSPTPIAVAGVFSIAEASYTLLRGGGLRIHQAAAKAEQILTRQLGTDVYAVRPSEYDLRLGELLTSVSGVLNLSSGPYIPTSVVRIASFDLVDLPAMPLRSSAAIAVREPADNRSVVATPWGVGESLFHQPNLPYIYEPPLIPGGYIPDPNAREVHITMNAVNVVALPNNEPLAVADIKIDLDLESYSWKLSCDVLNAASIALLKPDASGNKELAVEINGHRWVFFVASWSQSKTVTDSALNRRFSISGYSRTQYLGLPYAPKRTRSIGTTTAVQAVGDELLGTGFATNWNVTDLPDWAMPNASFSYQELTALQVIKRLATAVGAVVQPAMDTDALTVRPRYLPAPWELATAEMDRTIHESQILSEGGQLETNDLINAVFVTGESEGVALTVTRAGTAGDIAGQDVVDAWLTAIEANTSRGKQEIAASGDRIISTLELAIPESTAQPGLLLPGHAVAVIYNDSALSYRAYVTAVAISVPGRGLAKVRQTVTLERPIGWEV